MIVVADDFTGAAEIAAVSFEGGYSARVHRVKAPIDLQPDCHLVLDTDSRLKSSEQTKAVLAPISKALSSFPAIPVYKKVDSILRGNVSLELCLLAQILGKKRILLLPQNPSGGRTIKDRTYRINGIPLSQTEFASDPTHPAQSDSPLDLLGQTHGWSVSYCSIGDALPTAGIVILEAERDSEVQRWSKQVKPDDLAAGGRDFYRHLVGTTQREPRPFDLPTSTLLIQGTLSPERERLHQALKGNTYLDLQLSPAANPQKSIDLCASSASDMISSNGLAILGFRRENTSSESAAAEIERALRAVIATALNSSKNVAIHLAIEGGATAALILKILNLDTLEVIQIWGDGVVSLQSEKSPNLTITTKPGSYAWPPALVEAFCPKVIEQEV
nr:four-carbon acid sugar kinase family protein [Pelagicoccus albus]